ncbi:MAG: hypothetical protein MUC66_06490 [Methanolinea sp.]|jgi:tetratricopeptide (TPR) repeat protein|nr:hypothetical protein [Methanolinea sp.]
MDSQSAEERKKLALQLFEQGDFQGSYSLCRDLIHGSADPAVSVLCATNLFHMGRLDEAEAYFRDLTHSLPGSSHVHSYLGRILEKKGDDRALAEFTRAVALDPENLEALRSYASFVLAIGDPGKAIPVLRHLTARSGRADDSRLLVRAFLLNGMPSQALEVRTGPACRGLPVDSDFIRVLAACGRYAELADAARAEYERTGDLLYASSYLAALTRSDPDAAPVEYERILAESGDPGIRYEYVRMQRGRGGWAIALRTLGPLLIGREVQPLHLLEECELLAGLGNKDEARDHFQRLINRELEVLGDMEFLARLLSSYRAFLRTHYPIREAEVLLKKKLEAHPDVICLLSMASFYEDIGDHTEARSWYYRAYRSDFLTGGPEYARFCERQGELRECEKVMLYVLNSIRKNNDLIRVAGMVMEDTPALYRMPRLMGRLKERLEERAGELSSQGLEFLALSLLVSASHALEAGDHTSCKRSCLEGLDYIPPGSRNIHPEDFLVLLEECKRRSLCDLPVLAHASMPDEQGGGAPDSPELHLDLDETERKIVDFLKTHHQASEMDLRLLLGTRRVGGMVNRIMQKAAAGGLIVIEKRGVGKDGEIYAYKRS